MVGKKRKGRRAYYGKKGGVAEYKDEMKFDIYSTLKRLRDYYDGKSEDDSQHESGAKN
jgi:hypothetical protein